LAGVFVQYRGLILGTIGGSLNIMLRKFSAEITREGIGRYDVHETILLANWLLWLNSTGSRNIVKVGILFRKSSPGS